tara:strand:+ start:37 stop:666 length:630 start_codon:yes stop_codon:yes gene_type:complete
MPVTINGDGSITGLSVGGLGSGVVNTASIANGAVTNVKHGTGSIIQVQTGTFTGTNNISLGSAATFYELDDFNVTITSTVANSKFLVSCNFTGEPNFDDYELGIRVQRTIGGSVSPIFVGDAAGSRTRVLGMSNQGYHNQDNNSTCASNSYSNLLDAPNQSAGTAIKYAVYINRMASTGSYALNRTWGNADANTHERTFSNMTVMEVAP